MHALVSRCRPVIVLAVVVLAASCSRGAEPAATPSVFDAASNSCTSVFNLRNGVVQDVQEAGGEAVWGELQSALAAASDDRYRELHEHLVKIKDRLTTVDGGYIQPGQGDLRGLMDDVEAAARACVSLEERNLVD